MNEIQRVSRRVVTRITVLSVLVLAMLLCASAEQSRAVIATGASCPDTLPSSIHSTRPGAATALVPPGAVAVLLCTYHQGPNSIRIGSKPQRPGSNRIGSTPPSDSDSNQLEHERFVSERSQVTVLTRDFNALRPMPTGATACPADTGSAELAIFSYRNKPDDPIKIGLSGCEVVSNGHAARSAAFPPSGSALLNQLSIFLA